MNLLRTLSVLASQRPSSPPSSVAVKTRVQRKRHGGVPVTWLDAEENRVGTVIHLHGGDYLRGENGRTWAWLEELTRRSHTTSAMVHFRLPPRFPFPAALNDVISAIRELAELDAVNNGRWVLSGDNAGGGLALAVAQELRRQHLRSPDLLMLTSPWLDLTHMERFTPEQRRAVRLYAGEVDAADPRISPVFGSMEDLPPIHLTTGGADPLVGDGRRLVESVQRTGGNIMVNELPGADHSALLDIDDPYSQTAMREQIVAVHEAVGVRAA